MIREIYDAGIPILKTYDEKVEISSVKDKAENAKKIQENLTQHCLTLEEHKKLAHELGGFYFLKRSESTVYTLGASTIGRLIYLATYMNYENRLLLDNNWNMLKSNLPNVLRISKDSARTFYKECISTGILIDMKKDGLYLFDDFYKGKSKNKDRVKIYKNTVREIYEKLPTSAHRYFGYIAKLIPHINIEWNIVCKNIYETDIRKIEPYTVAELCNIWGYNDSNAQRFLKIIEKSKFNFNGKQYSLCAFVSARANRTKYMYIYVNPHAMYIGTHLSNFNILMPVFEMEL